jgi:ATP-dependent helicase HrpB
MVALPIENVLPALRNALEAHCNVVLTASPGAGKTTHVPLALLNEPWRGDRRILLLEPRRLAARAAAHRMAVTRGESVGDTVGYRMRLDTKVGPRTAIEVVTDGVLTRLLQDDPALSLYAAVLFDEFHERSLQSDAGLTLCLETQRIFRPDLRLLVMSATLDDGAVSTFLGQAPVIVCEGRQFPVDTCYLDEPVSGPLDAAVTAAIRRALARDRGSLLVFLPGMADIRRVERKLLDAQLGPDVHVAPLHGDLPQAVQDAAIAPAPPGTRKVVLATSIAETSLTIDGIRVVIDGGLLRVPRFDPRSGLSRLDTIRVTQDSADQRRGRAGRLEPGICYRLWTEKEQTVLAPRRPPEILEADLAPLLLDLAQWGAPDPRELAWLTPPPPSAIAHAKELLTALGALNANGRLTEHGGQMAALPIHPRLAHMLIAADSLRLRHLACDVAALLSEPDILRATGGAQRETDLRVRLDLLHGTGTALRTPMAERGILQRVRRTADLWRRQRARVHPGYGTDDAHHVHAVGLLLALAYPDRIAGRQPGGRYVLSNGRGALFDRPDPLGSEPFLVIADLEGGQWARIDVAAPIGLEDICRLYGDRISEEASVDWDEKAGAVRASRRRMLGRLVLTEEPLGNPDGTLVTRALLQGVREAGLDALAWTPELRQWRARLRFMRHVEGPDAGWPDVSDDALLEQLEQWLTPFLAGVTTLERAKRLDLSTPLRTLLTWEQQRRLDRLAPTHVTVPSGSSVRIDYDQPDMPVLAVRLQEMFGCRDTPRIADGKVPIMLQLLSPAKRPVQVTKDLGSFWRTAYQEVRKELRGRYPKHHWPDDPLSAPPTARTKKRS